MDKMKGVEKSSNFKHGQLQLIGSRVAYLGKNTVSTIVKSCKSKSRLGLVVRLVIFWPSPNCIAAISSEVGFCSQNKKPIPSRISVTNMLFQQGGAWHAYLGKNTLSTM